MESITIGSFNISLELLIRSASVLAGYLVLKWRLHVLRNIEGTSIDHLMNNILIAGLLIWKFSPLILDFQLVIHDPLSLIYFNGGTNGLWIATLYGCIVLMIHTWRKKLSFFMFPDLLLTFYLASSALYSLLYFILLQGGVRSLALGLLGLVMVIAQFKSSNKRMFSFLGLVVTVLWYSMGRTVIAFVNGDNEIVVYGIAAEQLFFLSAAGISFLTKIMLERRTEHD
ncbi:hypothetical protein BK131_11825 [Paenibacillus amylolyticus]|uniref:Uncharacterized protein n=1 Tax=Paenibacillus amylolyticus TaxID=1451 RepID=A0A1R1C0G6_PAEAM|nr:hypothetical protein [Paenibacillus amylolyticus]OMF15537.1 hypothetical protein BK131_11825 [Paenibacillus amylolyticus]